MVPEEVEPDEGEPQEEQGAAPQPLSPPPPGFTSVTRAARAPEPPPGFEAVTLSGETVPRPVPPPAAPTALARPAPPAEPQESISQRASRHLLGIAYDQLKQEGYAPDDVRMFGPSLTRPGPPPPAQPPAVMARSAPLAPTAELPGMLSAAPGFEHMATFLGNDPGSQQIAVARGMDRFAQGLLTPENVALLGGTAAATAIVGPVAPLVAGGYFTVKMLSGLFDQFPDLKRAAEQAGETGDFNPLIEKATELGLTGMVAAISAAHTATGGVAGAKNPRALVGGAAGDVLGLGRDVAEATGAGLGEGLRVPKGVEPPAEAVAEAPVPAPVAEKTQAPPPVEEPAPPLFAPREAEKIRESSRYDPAPPQQDLATLLVNIGKRGDIVPDDVPQPIRERIRGEAGLLDLQEAVGQMKGQVGRYKTTDMQGNESWMGVKSVLPDILQKYKYAYDDIANIVTRTLNGEKLTDKQRRFAADAFRYYSDPQRSGLLDHEDVLSYLMRHDSGSAAIELMFRDRAAAEGGQVAPDHLQDLTDFFGAEAAAERAAIGEPVPLSGASGESHEMPTGDTVEKLNPPATFFREAVRLLLDDPRTPEEFQAAAEWILKPRYGIEAPVEVRLEDVPLSRIEQVGKGWRITLPAKAEPYELLHEFGELRNRLGDPRGEPLHDNNVIADKFVKEATRSEGSIPPTFADEALSDKSGIAESVKSFLALSDEDPLGTASAGGAAALGFYGKKAIESAKAPLRGFYDDSKDFAKRIVNVVAPEWGAPVPTRLALAEKIGATNHMKDEIILRAIEQKWLRRTMKMSDQELLKVVDELKGDGEVSDPILRPFKAFSRAIQDRNHAELSEIVPSLPYLENRLSVFYTPESVAKLKEVNPAKYRSIVGSQRWLKQSVYETLSDAVEAGLIPRSYNPIQLLLWDIMDQRKFIDGHRLWQQAVSSGNAVAVPRDAPPPVDGWRRMDFDRRVLKNYLQDPEGKMPLVDGVPEAMQAEAKGPQDWWLEPNFYRILANHLSRDLVRENPIFSRILKYTMMDKAITLAVPAWHGTLETIGAAGSELVGGAWRAGHEIAQGVNLDGNALVRSIGRMLSSPVGGFTISRLGGKVRQLISNPEEFLASNKGWLDSHPGFQEEVEAAYKAGAGWNIPADFRQGYFGAIRSAIQDRNPALAAFRAGVRLVPDLSEFIAGPMFNSYIPRLHWGVYLKEIADAKVRYADEILSGKMDQQELRRRVWNSVYDRFGRVQYDNWFWNRTFKSSLQLLLLSPAWLGGDVRLALTAAGRQASEIGQTIDMLETSPEQFSPQFSGRMPRLAPEMQALASVLIPSALISTIFQTAMTSGQMPPWKSDTPLEDLVWPRTGKFDPDGHPKRVAFPGYGPAYWSMVHDPFKHLQNALAPAAKRLIEAMPWNNRKFYTGEFVYNPEDSRFKQALDAFRYAAFGNWPGIGEGPFFQQNIARMAKEDSPIGAKATSFLGVRPAPSYLDKTSFEEAVDRIRNRFLPAGKPKDEVERADRLRTARQLIREGGDAAELLRSGDFSIRQQEGLAKSTRLTPYQSMFSQLGLKGALEAWRHISDAERAKYLPLLHAKIVDPKTGEPKAHVWDSYSKSEIPMLREELQRALSGR